LETSRANLNHTLPTQHAKRNKVGIASTFVPFNVAVLFSSQNSQNKGNANVKGFTVTLEKMNG